MTFISREEEKYLITPTSPCNINYVQIGIKCVFPSKLFLALNFSYVSDLYQDCSDRNKALFHCLTYSKNNVFLVNNAF